MGRDQKHAGGRFRSRWLHTNSPIDLRINELSRLSVRILFGPHSLRRQPMGLLPALRDSLARVRVPTNFELHQDFKTSTACPADVT